MCTEFFESLKNKDFKRGTDSGSNLTIRRVLWTSIMCLLTKSLTDVRGPNRETLRGNFK